MSIFHLYFNLGIDHIMDFKGYDHILFVMTLCVVYTLKEWRRVLILVTAFTIGHSTTLVLATLNILKVNMGWIEFLIPLTIFFTALYNALTRKDKISHTMHLVKYASALFFGLIHGLGFSNYLRSLLGSESSIIKPLFAFNLGIELGQIIIVLIIMFITWLFVTVLRAPRREWNLVLSGAALGISFILMAERLPF